MPHVGALIADLTDGAAAPNKRLQLTAFGAQDRCFFDALLCCAPRRQLNRNAFGGRPLTLTSSFRHYLISP
jgi:hypothetical protein